MRIHLNGIRMRTASTDKSGVCSPDTILEFVQSGNLVSARYKGGAILDGYLLGHLEGNVLACRYVQADVDGNLDSGSSTGTFVRLPNQKLLLVEHFQWDTRPESGTNTFEEV